MSVTNISEARARRAAPDRASSERFGTVTDYLAFRDRQAVAEWAERVWLREEAERRRRLRRLIGTAFPLSAALFALLWFAGQLLRAVL